MSLMVMSPLRLPSASTTSSFSMRYLWSRALDSSRVIPTWAVTRRSLVITSLTFCFRLVSKRRSRLVTMPTNFLPSTTGMPEMR